MCRRDFSICVLPDESEEIKKLKSLEIRVDFRDLVCYTNNIVEIEGCDPLKISAEDLDKVLIIGVSQKGK